MEAKIVVKIYPESEDLCGQCMFLRPIKDVEAVSFCAAFELPLSLGESNWAKRCDDCRKQSAAMKEKESPKPIKCECGGALNWRGKTSLLHCEKCGKDWKV